MLFGLPGFRVLGVRRIDERGTRWVLVETIEPAAGCPACGVISDRVHERPLMRVKDLPVGGGPVQLWWRKRRYRCGEPACPRRSFTETSAAVPARSRLTGRLRHRLATAVARFNRAVADVAADYGVAWWTVHRALVAAAAAAALLPAPSPTPRIGVDETRARSVRWLLADAGWRRSDPWMTSIVYLDPSGGGTILGLAPGRSGACIEGWLAMQDPAFREAVEVVAIDPSAPYVGFGDAKASRHLINRVVLDFCFHGETFGTLETPGRVSAELLSSRSVRPASRRWEPVHRFPPLSREVFRPTQPVTH